MATALANERGQLLVGGLFLIERLLQNAGAVVASKLPRPGELLVGGLFGHFWQCFHELLLGIVDILQLMYEQVVHGLDVIGEESHYGHPFIGEHAGAGLFPAGHALHARC
jgi:hypothetical protein